MKKNVFTFLFFVLFSEFTFAQSNIPLTTDIPDPEQDDTPRSLIAEPVANLFGASLIIDFPVPTVSQVIIRDAESGTVVYSAPYDTTRQVVVNLSSLPEGNYELHVYAFGKWWWGEFEIEED